MPRNIDLTPTPGSYGEELQKQQEGEIAMADKETTKSEGHNNPPDVSKVIQECVLEDARIKEERKTLNEAAAKMRERLNDVGIQNDAFRFHVKIASMEAEAQTSYIEDLRTCMLASGMETQVDLFAADPDHAPDAGEGKGDDGDDGEAAA